MSVPFPSEEWVAKYRDAINASADYKVAAKDWTYGVIALICKAKPPFLEKDIGIWLDLEKGVCREAKIVIPEEAAKAPFCITGEYDRWKAVVKGELEPVKGMMQGKLKLKGNLPTIVRFVKAAQELVKATNVIDTKFLDE
ncbi:MAG: SCP2 sterol-binding domain-containing protein [Myxococcota bacterium]